MITIWSRLPLIVVQSYEKMLCPHRMVRHRPFLLSGLTLIEKTTRQWFVQYSDCVQMKESLQTVLANSTILLAEDNNDDAFLMCRAFHKAHLLNPVIRVRNGEEAIAYLRGDGAYSCRDRYPFPFLLLLDLKMPLADGFDVLSWVRNQPDLKRMLTVVLTSSTREPDVKKAYELGANSYLIKPGGFDELTQLLNRLHGYWFMTNISPDASPPQEVELAK